jgi:protein-disulfide isomerase
MRLMLFACTVFFISSGAAQVPSADKCQPLSPEVKERVESYLFRRLLSGTGDKPFIKSVEVMRDSCYRKLTMSIPGTRGDSVMYLSPDERFLTAAFYDLSTDPEQEVALIANNVNKLLERDESPRLVGSASRLTLVEFGDLQCPYCREFAEWYQGLPEALRSQLTLVFKHVPLKQHAWARSAAVYTACANKQSPAAFWNLETFLFQHQSEITADTIQASMTAELSRSGTVNLQLLLSCVQSPEGARIVDRDIGVAEQLGVRNTPTLFIDGRRAITPRSKDQLQTLLESELQRATSPLTSRPNLTSTKGDVR